MGAPTQVNLIELGPGRGTLMADALRAARSVPDFRAAVAVHLVETSPVLRAQAAGAARRRAASWHERVEDVPDGPAIAIANEFVDALPVDQFVKDRDGWHLRMVGLADDRLGFVVMPDPTARLIAPADAPVGAILERRHDQPIALLARRIADRAAPRWSSTMATPQTAFGDTLQAVRAAQFRRSAGRSRRGRPHRAGRFRRARRTARDAQARAPHGPVTQGEFLRRLGIAERAARLKAKATPQQAADIDAALARLTARGPDGRIVQGAGDRRSEARRAAGI